MPPISTTTIFQKQIVSAISVLFVGLLLVPPMMQSSLLIAQGGRIGTSEEGAAPKVQKNSDGTFTTTRNLTSDITIQTITDRGNNVIEQRRTITKPNGGFSMEIVQQDQTRTMTSRNPDGSGTTVTRPGGSTSQTITDTFGPGGALLETRISTGQSLTTIDHLDGTRTTTDVKGRTTNVQTNSGLNVDFNFPLLGPLFGGPTIDVTTLDGTRHTNVGAPQVGGRLVSDPANIAQMLLDGSLTYNSTYNRLDPVSPFSPANPTLLDPLTSPPRGSGIPASPTVFTPPIDPITGRPVADPKDTTPQQPSSGLTPPGIDVIAPTQPSSGPSLTPPGIDVTAPTQPTGSPLSGPGLPSLPALPNTFDPFDTLMNALPSSPSVPTSQSPSGGFFITDLLSQLRSLVTPSTPSTPQTPIAPSIPSAPSNPPDASTSQTPSSGGFLNTVLNIIAAPFTALANLFKGGSDTQDTSTQSDAPSGTGGGSPGTELDIGGFDSSGSSGFDPFGGLGDFGDGVMESPGDSGFESSGFESNAGQSEIEGF